MPENRKIIFRADGGPAIGMGHFIRTLALAEMLKDDFYCIYATQSPSPYQIQEIENVCHERIDLPADNSHFDIFLSQLKGDEIVVLDNYYFTTDYQKAIKDKGCKLVCIDDMHDKHFVADVVINHAPIPSASYSTEAYTKLLLGFNYSLIRGCFFESVAPKDNSNFKHVLVCFGGADQNNLTNRTLQSIYKIDCIETISVVVGNSFCHLNELENVEREIAQSKRIRILHNLNAIKLVEIIREVDFAIVPCSTILFEVLSQQKPVITGFYVDNQTEISTTIKDKFAHIMVVGDLNRISINQIIIQKLKDQVLKFGTTSLISNKTPDLFRNEFSYLNQEFTISLRRANNKDVDIYYDWVNDPDVRKNSINTGPILYQDHLNWFQNKIIQNSSALYIFEENNTYIGQVRFDKENDGLVIDYSVDINSRGKNLGKVIMKKAIEFLNFEGKTQSAEYFIAKVKESNIASLRVFESLNFELISEELVHDIKFIVLKKNI